MSQLCRDFGTEPHKGTKGPERQRVSTAQLRFAGTPGPWGTLAGHRGRWASPPGGRRLTHMLIIVGVMWLLGKDTHISGAEQSSDLGPRNWASLLFDKCSGTIEQTHANKGALT